MPESTGAKMSAIETATQYSINPGLSRFTVRAFATGMLSSFGHNPTLAVRSYTVEISIRAWKSAASHDPTLRSG